MRIFSMIHISSLILDPIMFFVVFLRLIVLNCMYIFHNMSLIIIFFNCLCLEHVRTLICLDMHTHRRMRMHPYPGVRTFHEARIFVLVFFFGKSTLIIKCVRVLLTTYASLNSIRFFVFSVSFIFNAMFYYLSLMFLSIFTHF